MRETAVSRPGVRIFYEGDRRRMPPGGVHGLTSRPTDDAGAFIR
jgi:hypothetical protein